MNRNLKKKGKQKNWLLEKREKMNNYLARLTLKKENTQIAMSELKGLLLLILWTFKYNKRILEKKKENEN